MMTCRLLLPTILAALLPSATFAVDVRTFAGTGEKGFSGDGGPATSAQLNIPHGMAADSQGNLYIVDASRRVRRVDAQTGIITTIAGVVGPPIFSGDGGDCVESADAAPVCDGLSTYHPRYAAPPTPAASNPTASAIS